MNTKPHASGMSKRCLVCNDVFYRQSYCSLPTWQNRKKYCSKVCFNKRPFTEEYKQKISNGCMGRSGNSGSFQKGIQYNLGKKFPSLQGSNNPRWTSQLVRCDYCKKNFFKELSQIRKRSRHFCNRQCWALGTRGKGSPVFMGELATKPLRHRIMELAEYSDWHATILKRDKYTCVLCGTRNTKGNSVILEVDHIKRFHFIIIENNIKTTDQARNCQELWSIENGRTLCRECHRKTDTFGTTNLKRSKKS